MREKRGRDGGGEPPCPAEPAGSVWRAMAATLAWAGRAQPWKEQRCWLPKHPALSLLPSSAPEPALQRSQRTTCKCPLLQTRLLLPRQRECCSSTLSVLYTDSPPDEDLPIPWGIKKPSALWASIVRAKIHQCILVPNCSQVLAACRAEEHLWTWPQQPECCSHGRASALSEPAES